MFTSKSELSAPSRKNWISIHIGADADQDTVLRVFVDPLVDSLQRRSVIETFFFLRETEGRSEIRLRLALTRDISPEHLRRIISVRASRSLDPGQLCVSYHPYNLELSRFGGPYGLAVSDDVFHISSQLALKAIRFVHPARDHRRRWASHMMWMGAHAFKVPPSKLSLFFERYSQYAAHSMGIPYGGAVDSTILAKLVETLTDETLLETFEEREALSIWFKALDVAADRLRNLCQLGLLHMPDVKPASTSSDDTLLTFLAFYVHLMNNRLGLRPSDEYIVSRAIGQILHSGEEEIRGFHK